MILLDTHVWLWWLLGDGGLSDPERDELDRLAFVNKLALSWVSLWETEMLERKGRIRLSPDFQQWIRLATNKDFIRILPADVEVVIAQRELPEFFHGDPADRLITATSILSGFPLATHDRRIRQSDCCDIWSGSL
jgi:PIN domain nuclease of toxin-antitoxin system